RAARYSAESGTRSGPRCLGAGVDFPVDCLSIESLKLIMAWIESYTRRTRGRPARLGGVTGDFEHDGHERQRERWRGARECDVPERLVPKLAFSRLRRDAGANPGTRGDLPCARLHEGGDSGGEPEERVAPGRRNTARLCSTWNTEACRIH